MECPLSLVDRTGSSDSVKILLESRKHVKDYTTYKLWFDVVESLLKVTFKETKMNRSDKEAKDDFVRTYFVRKNSY